MASRAQKSKKCFVSVDLSQEPGLHKAFMARLEAISKGDPLYNKSALLRDLIKKGLELDGQLSESTTSGHLETAEG